MVTNVLLITFALVAIVWIIRHASERNKIILGDQNSSSEYVKDEDILKDLNKGKYE